MTIFTFLETLITCLLLFLYPRVYGYAIFEVKSWCNQTPHPESCEYFLADEMNSGTLKRKPDFVNALLKVTLDRVTDAEIHTRGLDVNNQNNLEKAAWNDCLQLYQNTINRLNMTVNPNDKLSQADTQTWLSTALTNLETCKNGFEELAIGGDKLPPMNHNVSYLISNVLAINNQRSSMDNEASYRKGFPTWVKPRDRKLLQYSTPLSQATMVVAQDGSGNYNTIGEAIAAANSDSERYVIYVREGIYDEYVEIGSKLKNIMLFGDGIGKTIITGNKSAGGGLTTFQTATLTVDGDGFMCRGITVRNTAGPENHQAVAVRSGSDLSIFYQCSFEGYQDTLYVHSNRQFFKECDIYGTVDFIFGNSATVLQDCNIYARDPPNKVNTITAQGRIDANQNTGISIHNCRVMAVTPLIDVKTYLGRPWKQYSRTVFMKTYIDDLVHPEGWMPWKGDFALDTLYYGEYMNTGPGSYTASRVSWKGYKVITNYTEAAMFTVEGLIDGGDWLPASGVSFTSGL